MVLERGANSGHVGFLEDWDDNRVRLLGGNQGNAVGSAWFPLSRVLGYRVPARAVMPQNHELLDSVRARSSWPPEFPPLNL